MSTLTVPAEQTEDFRLAAADMVAEIASWVRTQQEQLREAEELDDAARIEVARTDLAHARGHLPAYGEVLRQAAASESEIDGDAGALGFVCANLAEQLTERLYELKPHGAVESADEMLPLTQGLTWPLEHTARLTDEAAVVRWLAQGDEA